MVEYDRCPSSHTVALPDGTYCYCSLEVDRPFREFLPYAAAEQERVKAAPTLEDGEDGESLFFVYCVPWLSYPALTQPTPTPADSNPRITWGRWHRQEGRTLLPMTLLANHALVDGIHIARFYENLDRELAALCGGEKDAEIHQILSTVYRALEEKGYNPINQIVGYILSEDPTYITNHNNARTLIRKIDRDELLQVLVRRYLGQ